MAPANKAGLSEYELQRIKNLEENRKILKSIRKEVNAFEDCLQAPVKKKKDEKSDPESKLSKKKISKAKLDKQPNENQGFDTENSSNVQRKSARLCGKKPKVYWRNSDGDDNSDDEDFDGGKNDDSCSGDEEYFHFKKKKNPQPRGPKQKIVVPKNRPNFYGAVPGVEVGRIWETRMACCADGIHRPTVAGIHGGPEGAYSISLSGGYEDDVDTGDCFTYTGEGGRALKGTSANPKNLRTAPQSKDQTLTRGNLALSLNVSSRKPIRVIRGSNLNNEFAPEYGYRYDGLYTVEKYWLCVGKSGFKVYKFAMRRCPDQAPPPWISGVVTHASIENAKEEDIDEEMDDEDSEVPKPTVLRVKLFKK